MKEWKTRENSQKSVQRDYSLQTQQIHRFVRRISLRQVFGEDTIRPQIVTTWTWRSSAVFLPGQTSSVKYVEFLKSCISRIPDFIFPVSSACFPLGRELNRCPAGAWKGICPAPMPDRACRRRLIRTRRGRSRLARTFCPTGSQQ